MNNQLGPLILGIDLEGINENLIENGINPQIDRVSEIGAVVWDWNLSQPIELIHYLIDEADRLPISSELEELTGINDQMLETYGKKGNDIADALDYLAKVMEQVDYFMAHNGSEYDRPMLGDLFKRHGKKMPDKVWIDTLKDIEFPSKITGRSMIVLEHLHGFINPFPHRAVTDVLSMLKIASQYDLSRMLKLARSPKVQIAASFEAPNWRDKEEVEAFNKVKRKVSKAYFKWNPDEKIWSKTVHQVLIDEGKINYDFDWYIRS